MYNNELWGRRRVWPCLSWGKQRGRLRTSFVQVQGVVRCLGNAEEDKSSYLETRHRYYMPTQNTNAAQKRMCSLRG